MLRSFTSSPLPICGQVQQPHGERPAVDEGLVLVPSLYSRAEHSTYLDAYYARGLTGLISRPLAKRRPTDPPLLPVWRVSVRRGKYAGREGEATKKTAAGAHVKFDGAAPAAATVWLPRRSYTVRQRAFQAQARNAAGVSADWTSLPTPVMMLLFERFMTQPEIARTALVCKAWCATARHPSLWIHWDFGWPTAAAGAGRLERVLPRVIERRWLSYGTYVSSRTLAVHSLVVPQCNVVWPHMDKEEFSGIRPEAGLEPLTADTPEAAFTGDGRGSTAASAMDEAAIDAFLLMPAACQAGPCHPTPTQWIGRFIEGKDRATLASVRLYGFAGRTLSTFLRLATGGDPSKLEMLRASSVMSSALPIFGQYKSLRCVSVLLSHIRTPHAPCQMPLLGAHVATLSLFL